MRISDWISDVCSSDLQDPLQRLAAADMADQLLHAAGTGNGAELHFGQADAGSGGHQAKVAGQGEFAAAAEREAVDGGDHRIGLLFQAVEDRSEEHTSELQSLMRISYAVFCLKKNRQK